VVEENHDYDSIIGNPSAPYINSLVDNGALFTDYQGITNPSQPNYLALYSGSTQGVTDNRTYFFDQPTLGGQLEAAGLSFLATPRPTRPASISPGTASRIPVTWAGTLPTSRPTSTTCRPSPS